MEELKMANNRVETAKADTKKVVADIGNKVAHAKADVNADVEKIKAEHGEAEKKVAYAKADIKADAEKAKADVENKAAHVKADAEKARAEIGKKMSDVLK
jgi:hypothetical protein